NGGLPPTETTATRLAARKKRGCAILDNRRGRAASSSEILLDIHLDPLGGWSGDMFVAALLDAFPEYWPRVQSTIASLNLGAECRLAPHRDDAFAGSRFLVAGDRTASEQPAGRQRAVGPGDPSHPHEGSGHHEHAHVHLDRGGERAWSDIRAELARSGLDADVK